MLFINPPCFLLEVAMSRKRKIKRTRMAMHEEQEEGKIDRLSDLPDSILVHILSFMETKFAVRTCLLSKRWKFLWTCLADIYLSVYRNEAWFGNFVHQLFVDRNHIALTNFSFYHNGSFGIRYDKKMIKRIVKYAVSHSVKHLSIGLDYVPLSFLSPVLSRCQSLTTLKLTRFEEAALVGSFGTLTTLILFECSFSDSQISLDPFSSLDNLKDLQLSCCRFEGFFKISAPQLYRLALRYMFTYNEGKVEIVAPKLSSFSYQDTCPGSYCYQEIQDMWPGSESFILDLPVLENAYIDVWSVDIPWKDEIENRKARLQLNMIDMFRGLCHVRFLKLSFRTVQVLTQFPGILEHQPSPFYRLKTLKFQYENDSFNLPHSLVNYFQSSSTFGENVKIELQKVRRIHCFRKIGDSSRYGWIRI